MSRGCTAEDWGKVLFSEDTDFRLISSTGFLGEVRVRLPGGLLQNTVLESSVIWGPATIRGNRLIRGYTVLAGSVLEQNGVLQWDGSPGALRGEMFLGEETGCRRVPILPELNHLDAFRMATLGSSGTGRREAREGTIGPGAVIRCAPLVENSLLLRETLLDCPGPVRDSVLLPGASVLNHAQVHGSVLQWRARADTMALVLDSVAGEGSVVEGHGRLSRSFLGADSVLGQGEVTASLVGPMTGIHHQSLLIATLWPGGKGNVGYGANAGSNHTSRLPDQELRLGDGVFVGLGASIKFPADYTLSPYTVLATGVVTLPQKVSFPFSLISPPAHRPSGTPEGFNRLSPGWMLTDNLYALARSAWKIRSRSTATHTPVDRSLLTPEILAMVEDALNRLRSHGCSDMPGKGKNFLTEEDRIKGIKAYELLLEAEGLHRSLRNRSLDSARAARMGELLDLVEEGIRTSRNRDHARGRAIIEDYARVRPPPEEEPFLLEATDYLAGLRRHLDGSDD